MAVGESTLEEWRAVFYAAVSAALKICGLRAPRCPLPDRLPSRQFKA